MRFAYADPPYVGNSGYYRADPNHAEVDHNELLERLCRGYDAWALSCYTNSLKTILGYPACPDDIRVGAWVKPFCSWKPGQNPVYAWEPVLFWHPRKRGKDIPSARDWVSANMTMQKGLIGAKPIKVCYWIFEILGAGPGDDFSDLYPGTGIVSRAWENWTKRENHKELPLFTEARE